MSKKLNSFLSLVAIVVAIIALIIALLPKKSKKEPAPISPKGTTSVSIAYVDLDTLVNHYDLYNALMIKYMQKQQEYEKQLQSKLMSIQQRSMKLQNDYQKGLITTLTFQQKMQQLQNEQQSIQQWYQQKSQELLQDQQMINQRVMDSIYKAIEELNKNNTFQLIITKSALLYGDPGLNITDTLIQMLNAKVDLNQLQ